MSSPAATSSSPGRALFANQEPAITPAHFGEDVVAALRLFGKVFNERLEFGPLCG
jgi:hypothetical protein